jgi:hypothetical protein|tara:strand:- start:107352 stop:107564 length:213 start_codon:yes stop_codon:yes gene_type:complete
LNEPNKKLDQRQLKQLMSVPYFEDQLQRFLLAQTMIGWITILGIELRIALDSPIQVVSAPISLPRNLLTQ